MMIYKTLAFWIGSIIFILYGYSSCRLYKPFAYFIFGLMIWSLTWPDAFSITFFTQPTYKMATRGIEVHLVDLCSIVLFLYLIRTSRNRQIHSIPPTTLPQLAFILVAIMSWMLVEGSVANPLATHPKLQFTLGMTRVLELNMYPLYEISKLLRGLLVFWVTANFARDAKAIRIVVFIFSVLLMYFTAKSLFLRYGMGIHRVSAGIGHYNNFNTFVGLMGAFILPWAFATKNIFKSAVYWMLILCALVCIILTISRTALAAFGLMCIVGTPILLLRYLDMKNLFFIFLGCLAVAAIGLKSADALLERFTQLNPTAASLTQRTLLNNEAKMMARDFILGVGMGNFSAWSMLRYAALSQAEVGNFAHNSFYLTMAEVGYLGLAAFVMYWLRYIQIGWATFRQRIHESDEANFCTIMGVNLAVVFLLPQLWFQFTYRATPVYMLVHILLGIGVAQYLNIRDARPKQAPQRVRLSRLPS